MCPYLSNVCLPHWIVFLLKIGLCLFYHYSLSLLQSLQIRSATNVCWMNKSYACFQTRTWRLRDEITCLIDLSCHWELHSYCCCPRPHCLVRPHPMSLKLGRSFCPPASSPWGFPTSVTDEELKGQRQTHRGLEEELEVVHSSQLLPPTSVPWNSHSRWLFPLLVILFAGLWR